MNKKELLLLALASSEQPFSPVQIQKLVFLLQEKLAGSLGRPFKFSPYDYGPFDPAIYEELDALALSDLVRIDYTFGDRRRKYELTPKGRSAAEAVLTAVGNVPALFAKNLAAWVKSLSFAELVSAIYREFPTMKANSVFRG